MIDAGITALVAVFGLIIGSFLNVVIARLPEGRSIVRPGSACGGCGAPIRWHDNVPLLGFALLRGRCRACRAPISLRYPLVETITALLFVTSYLAQGLTPTLFLRDWPLLATLVAVTFIDLDHRIIPDPLSLGGLALALATSWLDPRLGLAGSAAGAAIGFGVFYFFAWAYLRLAGRSGLGGGDIKLLAMLGAFLGPSGVFCVILVSSVLGSVLGIAWALWNRRRSGDGSGAADAADVLGLAIPYGPFLVVGALYYYLLGDWLWLQFTIPT